MDVVVFLLFFFKKTVFDVVANVNSYFLAVKKYESEESKARAFERRKLL